MFFRPHKAVPKQRFEPETQPTIPSRQGPIRYQILLRMQSKRKC